MIIGSVHQRIVWEVRKEDIIFLLRLATYDYTWIGEGRRKGNKKGLFFQNWETLHQRKNERERKRELGFNELEIEREDFFFTILPTTYTANKAAFLPLSLSLFIPFFLFLPLTLILARFFCLKTVIRRELWPVCEKSESQQRERGSNEVEERKEEKDEGGEWCGMTMISEPLGWMTVS